MKGRLKANGTIGKRARGSVQVQLRFVPAGQTQARTVSFKARIVKGRFRLDQGLSAAVMRDVAASGAVSSYVLFAGDKRGGMAGQSSFFELPAVS